MSDQVADEAYTRGCEAIGEGNNELAAGYLAAAFAGGRNCSKPVYKKLAKLAVEAGLSLHKVASVGSKEAETMILELLRKWHAASAQEPLAHRCELEDAARFVFEVIAAERRDRTADDVPIPTQVALYWAHAALAHKSAICLTLAIPTKSDKGRHFPTLDPQFAAWASESPALPSIDTDSATVLKAAALYFSRMDIKAVTASTATDPFCEGINDGDPVQEFHYMYEGIVVPRADLLVAIFGAEYDNFPLHPPVTSGSPIIVTVYTAEGAYRTTL